MLKPEFFDIFGFQAFVFILIVSAWSLIVKKPIPDWVILLLLIIGILGSLIDGIIVYFSYLK